MGKQFLPLLFMLSGLTLEAQNSGVSFSNGGTGLLRNMTDRYMRADSWYIRATEEQSSRSEYNREWTKTLMTGAESGRKHHFEGRSAAGSALLVSDGDSAWILHPLEHAYTRQPAPHSGNFQAQLPQPNEQGALAAMNLRTEFADFSTQYEGAIRLRDESIVVGGTVFRCYVIRVTSARQKEPKVAGQSWVETLWIDKRTLAVRKKVIHEDSFLYSGSARIPAVTDTVTVYEKVELNSPLPDELFAFSPPADAKLVPRFSESPGGADMTGDMAPDVELVAPNGDRVPLASYRGKPVLLNFWATWCAPCLSEMPKLAELSRAAASKGLVTFSVDEDEDGKTATDFLLRHHYAWPNTHDNGSIRQAFQESAIPLAVLIDARGKVVFYKVSEDEAGLRKAIAGLGPEYALLAQEQNPRPCVTTSR